MPTSHTALQLAWRSAAYPAALVSAIGALWVLASVLTDLDATGAGFAGAIGWVPVLITAPTVVAAVAGMVLTLLLFPALRRAAPGRAAGTAGVASAAAAGLARAVVVSLKITIALAGLAAVVGLLAGPALEMTRLQGA